MVLHPHKRPFNLMLPMMASFSIQGITIQTFQEFIPLESSCIMAVELAKRHGKRRFELAERDNKECRKQKLGILSFGSRLSGRAGYLSKEFNCLSSADNAAIGSSCGSSWWIFQASVMCTDCLIIRGRIRQRT